jgi:hypothetical protein
MHHLKLITRLVDKLGGNEPLARAVGRDFSTISHWKKSGIPAHMWPRIARIAAQHGISTSVDRLEKTSPLHGATSRPRPIRNQQPAQAS